jgi:hypothetical protein
MKFGVSVTTTPNRGHIFDRWLENFEKYSKGCPDLFLYVHKDVNYRGIVYSKNKCLKALYEAGCTHFVLFDDDCIISQHLWWTKYVLSPFNHACWNYNRKIIKHCGDYNELQTPNGCMLYCKRIVLDTVGGFDPAFAGYSYEHVNWSDRIFNSGLTPARYIDVYGTKDLFTMADCPSSVSENIRAISIPKNYELYKQNYHSKEFKPFQ